MTADFEKHHTTGATLDKYEMPDSPSGYYRIWEVEHTRYIDVTKYKRWLEWKGTPDEINCDPISLTDDQKWVQIRAQRTSLLRNGDWTRLDDIEVTADTKNAWRDYRKVLRDIPQTYDDPDDVIWPIAPASLE